jgi:hypothetical protein
MRSEPDLRKTPLIAAATVSTALVNSSQQTGPRRLAQDAGSDFRRRLGQIVLPATRTARIRKQANVRASNMASAAGTPAF